jgi:hypothetical protein
LHAVETLTGITISLPESKIHTAIRVVTLPVQTSVNGAPAQIGAVKTFL